MLQSEDLYVNDYEKAKEEFKEYIRDIKFKEKEAAFWELSCKKLMEEVEEYKQEIEVLNKTKDNLEFENAFLKEQVDRIDELEECSYYAETFLKDIQIETLRLGSAMLIRKIENTNFEKKEDIERLKELCQTLKKNLSE